MPSDSFSKPASLPMPFMPADRLPAPEAVERDSDTAWQLFNELQQGGEKSDFTQTAPGSDVMPLPQGDRRYAATVPSALAREQAPVPARAAGAKAVTAEEAMVEARRNNRICPQPEIWLQLYEMLPDKVKGPRGWQPPPPMTGAAWLASPSLAKRMCLRDHIEWAEKHGSLDAVYALFKDLPESSWHHMGE